MLIARLALLSILCAQLVSGATINVVDHGAVGDGKTDDNNAFLKAWEIVCADAQSPTLLIPGEKTFLLSEIRFDGPCKSDIHIQVYGKLLAPSQIWTKELAHWITFSKVNDLMIDGTGQLDGQGDIWWQCKAKNQCYVIPYGLGISGCNNFKLSGLKFLNPPGKHFTVDQSVGIEIESLNIWAPEDSPNTDGIYIQKSQNIRISDSVIRTGDDCIAIGTETSNLTITGVVCGPGHGISIGSLGMNSSQATVENILVKSCSFERTSNGVRIKTWQGGSGYAKGIYFENVNFTEVVTPIIIDQFYCPHASCANQTSAIQVSDVRFSDAKGTTTTDVAIQIACSETVPCTGITLEDVNIYNVNQKPSSSYCLNVKGQSVGEVQPKVPCLS